MGKAGRLRNRQRYLDRVNAEERAQCGIPVFYLEQDTEDEAPGRGKFTRTEVREMKAANLGAFINHGQAFRLYESAPPSESRGESPAAALVPLFYRDQNRSRATPYFITSPQADAMEDAGRGVFINHRTAFQHCERQPAGPAVPCSDSGASDISISVNEMRANVGEPPQEPGAMLPRGTKKRAQQKIRAIGGYETGTTDTKAPLARDHRQNQLSLQRVRKTAGGDKLSMEMLLLMTRVMVEHYELFPAHPQPGAGGRPASASALAAHS